MTFEADWRRACQPDLSDGPLVREIKSVLAGEASTQPGVTAWRTLVLIQAGYPTHDATLLAEHTNVDLHEAVYLLEAGCTVETALLILL
jgi:hypothetical protein